jgi:hypothetical protein
LTIATLSAVGSLVCFVVIWEQNWFTHNSAFTGLGSFEGTAVKHHAAEWSWALPFEGMLWGNHAAERAE